MFFWQIFVKFMEKESSTKYYGVLTISHEAMTLHSFEFNVNDIITVNVNNTTPHALFLRIFVIKRVSLPKVLSYYHLSFFKNLLDGVST